MRVLAFDTSTFLGTVAIVDGGDTLAEISAWVRASHGETLLPHVERALASAALTLSDIDLIAVGVGPGSFTGVRIGVATAKGLALSEDKPLVGVSSLRTLARGVPASGLRASVLDAHKGEVYVAAFDLDEAGELEEVLAPFHAPPEQAAERLGQLAAGKSLWLAGGGVERYGERLTAPLSSWARRAPRFADAPRAVFLAHEAVRSFQLEGASDLDRLEPLYLRSSDAKLPAPRA